MAALGRYLLFAGFNYYPGGGWDDFVAAFDEPLEAFNKAKEMKASRVRGEPRCDWYQVVDTLLNNRVDG